MSSSKINVDSFTKSIVNILSDYQEVIQDDMEDVVKKTAKNTVSDIRTNAKTMFAGKGKYAKSWKATKNNDLRGKYAFSMIVHANEDGYRLAHLLENGHAKVLFGRMTGGRVAGRPHIAPAAEKAEKNFISDLKKAIEERR